MDVGPVHIKGLPKWCGAILLTAFLAIAMVYTWSQYGKDIYNPISKLEAAQFSEAQAHFFEIPEDEIPLDAGGVVRHYASDHCTAVQWSLSVGATNPTFAFHPDRTKEIMAGPHPLDAIKGAGMMGCYGPGPRCCWDPHPPPWNEKSQEMNQCVTRIHRIFPCGCAHYQDMDNCNRRIGPIIWTRCVH